MPALTAPSIEVTQVVTGFMYLLSVGEEENKTGITRIEFGPYSFEGVPPRVRYPEAVTNEMCPPGWQPICWVTDANGSSWLRYEGGELRPGDEESLFAFTSNYAASDHSGARMIVWRGTRSDSYDVPIPDYTTPPPVRNSRHDSQGMGRIYKQTGCMPQIILSCAATVVLFLHFVH